MNKQKTIAVIGSGLLVSGFAQAGVESEFHVGYNTDYIYRGVDLGHSAFEYGLSVGGEGYCGFNWSAGIWYITPSSSSQADELDIFAGVSKDFGWATAEVGFTNYSYPNGGDDDTEVYLGLSTEFQGFGLGATLFYGTDGILQDQFLGELSVSYGFVISEKLSGEVGVTGGFLLDEGDGGYPTDTGYVYSNFKAGLSYAVADNITLNPYIAYTDADESIGGFDGFYGGATLNFAF